MIYWSRIGGGGNQVDVSCQQADVSRSHRGEFRYMNQPQSGIETEMYHTKYGDGGFICVISGAELALTLIISGAVNNPPT